MRCRVPNDMTLGCMRPVRDEVWRHWGKWQRQAPLHGEGTSRLAFVRSDFQAQKTV